MRRSIPALFLAAALGLAACGADEGPHAFPEIRDRPEPARRSDPRLSTLERLRVPKTSPRSPSSQPALASWRWTTPDGWEEQESDGSRIASLRVAGHPDTDCSITAFPGDAGGLAENVNRWRDQMSLARLPPAAVQDLPRRALLGQEAVYVTLDGSYRSTVGRRLEVEGARLLGMILPLPSAVLFLKFVGPAEVVEAERAKFEALADSLHPVLPQAPPPPDPHGGEGPTSLAWTAPEGWEEQPDRMGREVTLAPAGTSRTQCYVVVLPRAPGIPDFDVNFWRQEMGQPPLSSEEIDDLPRLRVLGEDVPMIRITGDLQGHGGEEVTSVMLVGVIRVLASQTVFVKMTGPADEVAAAVDGFVAFSESLRR